jgi:hypothetical protein
VTASHCRVHISWKPTTGEMMTEVACFCGCFYRFSGDIGVCPKCGELVSFTRASSETARQMRDELRLLLGRGADVAQPRTSQSSPSTA